MRIAMPFVVTLVATSGCTRNSDNITPLPPTTAPTRDASPAPAPSGELTYDGHGGCFRLVAGEKQYVPSCPDSLLPEASKDALVYNNGGRCQQTPDAKVVRCPPGGPTVVLPDPSSITTATGSIGLRYGSLDCRSYHDVYCPPAAICNPPAPESVPCPAALLPKLAGGAKPTTVEGTRCFFGKIEVACGK